MSDFSLTFSGFDLTSIPYVNFSRRFPDDLPQRDLKTVRLPRASGERLRSSHYVSKVILVEGYIAAPDRSAMEVARDALLLRLQPQEASLELVQAGSLRTYIVTKQNVVWTHVQAGFARFSIEFRASDPFGHDPVMANPVNSLRNLITTNTSFESDASGWSSYNAGALFHETNVQLFNSASLRITTTGTGSNALQGASLNPAITATAGQSYTFSYWVIGTAGVVVRAYMSSGGADTFTALTLTGTWQRVQTTHVASSAALTPYIMIEGANSSVKSVFVDGIQLEQGTVATDYAEAISIGSRTRLSFAISGSYAVDPIVAIRLNGAAAGSSNTMTVTNKLDMQAMSITRAWGQSYALDFNGTGHRVTRVSDDFNMVDAISLSCWVNADTRKGVLFNKRFPSGNFRSYTFEHSGGHLRFTVTNVHGQATTVTAPTVYQLGIWTHCVAVYDGAYIRIYVNGAQVVQGVQSGPMQMDAGEALYIGSFDNSNNDFDGRIKTPRVWSRGLSRREVEHLFYGNYAPRVGLQLEYLMTEGSGTTLTDTSGRGNHGTITGATWATAPTEIVIDGIRREVSVNGTPTDFTGNFPSLTVGQAALEVSDNFSARNYSVMVAYDKRYL